MRRCGIPLAVLIATSIGLIVGSLGAQPPQEPRPLDADSVIFQAFYWDVPTGGTWYDTIRSHAAALRDAGFTHFWFPPPTKGAAGGYSMGYDLYDHYDLGQYDQKGTIETRFGSLAELQAAATACGNVVVDLVANHMVGAEHLSRDPRDGRDYWQGFQYVHDRFWKSASDFHPGDPDDCDLCDGNDAILGEDICHHNPYMFNGLLEWAAWLKTTIGHVGGFRLDAAKHFSWDMSRAFGQVAPCVGEFWDSADRIRAWMDYTGNWAFDFPLYYALQGRAADLDGAGLNHPWAVSFVANHDTNQVYHKNIAYGFILYIPHVPCVFWSDWFNPDLQPGIRRALAARRRFDFAGTRTIYKTDDLIVFANNEPIYGCFNSSDQALSATVAALPNSVYSAVAWAPGDPPADTQSDTQGRVTLSAPPHGYAYWWRDPDKNGPAGTYHTVHVPGDAATVFGSSWSFTERNRMTLVDDGRWRLVLPVPEPMHIEYKFAMNGTWDVNRGLGQTSGPAVPQVAWDLAPFGANIPADVPAGLCVWEYDERTETGRLFCPDFDGNGRVDLADFAILAQHYWRTDCGPDACHGTDLNRSGRTSPADLATWLQFWLTDQPD